MDSTLQPYRSHEIKTRTIMTLARSLQGFAQDSSGKQQTLRFLFPSDFCWPNPGPGRLALDWGSGDVEFSGVFASVASVAVSFVAELTLWNPIGKKKKAEIIFGLCFRDRP